MEEVSSELINALENCTSADFAAALSAVSELVWKEAKAFRYHNTLYRLNMLAERVKFEDVSRLLVA
jgi:hypothetical protein